jgi:predicted CXXCH cytochrome family protein
MKYWKQLLAAAAALLLLVPLAALSQDAVMVLKHKEVGPHQRPAVSFNHEKHSASIDCLQCHHDFDSYMNNRGGDGQPCSSCHNRKATKETIALTDAFHVQCKGCHENMRDLAKQAGPVMCGECHKK